MLTVISPNDLSPFDRPAEFTITSSEPAHDAGRHIVAVLTDTENDSVLAARRICLDSRGSARFDAAPVLRRTMQLRPAAGATGLAAAEDCRFRVQLGVRRVESGASGAADPNSTTGTSGSTGTADAAEVRSAAVTLLSTVPDTGVLTLVTSMPPRRTIRYGESDLLMFFAPSDFTVEVGVQAPSGDTVRSYTWHGGAGLVTLRLRTADWAADARQITVTAGGEVVAEYRVEASAGEGLRMAWRTAAGSVEHYTFGAVVSRMLIPGGRRVHLADGVCTVAGTEHTEAVVRSSYESRAMVGAIAEAAVAAQVWAVDGETGEYVSVEVTTQQVVTSRFGEPANVELTVRPSQNGVRI